MRALSPAWLLSPCTGLERAHLWFQIVFFVFSKVVLVPDPPNRKAHVANLKLLEQWDMHRQHPAAVEVATGVPTRRPFGFIALEMPDDARCIMMHHT